MNAFIKKSVSFLITLPLLLTPEVTVAVTNSTQEERVQEFVSKYNSEVHNFGDLQEFAKKYSKKGSSHLNADISTIDRKLKVPKLKYGDGKIQIEHLGWKLESLIVAKHMSISFEGRRFDLGADQNLEFSKIRPILNHMIVNNYNSNKILNESEYKNSGAINIQELKASDEYISYKDASSKKIFIKLLSVSEVEMKVDGKTFKFDSRLSPSGIEKKLKKEFIDLGSDQKTTLNKIINLFIGTAHAGLGEDASNFYDKNSSAIKSLVLAATALLVPLTEIGVLIIFVIAFSYNYISEIVSGSLHYIKKKEILKMISNCANSSDVSVKENQNLEKIQGASLQDALAKFDKLEKICSEDTKCSINNELFKCKLRTMELYRSLNDSSRSQQKERVEPRSSPVSIPRASKQ